MTPGSSLDALQLDLLLLEDKLKIRPVPHQGCRPVGRWERHLSVPHLLVLHLLVLLLPYQRLVSRMDFSSHVCRLLTTNTGT